MTRSEQKQRCDDHPLVAGRQRVETIGQRRCGKFHVGALDLELPPPLTDLIDQPLELRVRDGLAAPVTDNQNARACHLAAAGAELGDTTFRDAVSIPSRRCCSIKNPRFAWKRGSSLRLRRADGHSVSTRSLASDRFG